MLRGDEINPETGVGQVQGLLVAHVDDGCTAGFGDKYDQALSMLRKKLDVRKEEEWQFKFLGRRVTQDKDTFDVRVDQHDYVDQILPVTVPLLRKKQKEEKLTEAELSSYRSLVGKLSWPSHESMPLIAYDVSDLQQRTSTATVHDLLHANVVLRRAKEYCRQGFVLKFDSDVGESHDTTENGNGLATVTDSSWAGQRDLASQQGYSLLLSSTKIYEGPQKAHMLDWSSTKVKRKIRSTFGVETNAADYGVDRATLAQAIIAEIQTGPLGREWESKTRMIPLALATDCKSLHDALFTTSIPQEKRVYLDILDLRDCVENGLVVRWIPTNMMLVDGLTKHLTVQDTLEGFLRSSIYSLRYDEGVHFKAKAAKQARLNKKKNKVKATTLFCLAHARRLLEAREFE